MITATLSERARAFIDATDQVAETLYREQCEAFIGYYYKCNCVPAAGGILTQLRGSREA